MNATGLFMIAAVVVTATALALHVAVVARALRHTKRLALFYVAALICACILCFVTYKRITAGAGQVNKAGLKQFEEQTKMLDDMDDLQIELPAKSE